MKSWRKVIFVDDNPSDLLIHRFVAMDAGLFDEVVTYESPVEGLSVLRDSPLCDDTLLFLDINMPEISGFEFIEQYMSWYPSSEPYIVILTSADHQYEQHKAEQFPSIRGFLGKPLREDTLRLLLGSIAEEALSETY